MNVSEDSDPFDLNFFGGKHKCAKGGDGFAVSVEVIPGSTQFLFSLACLIVFVFPASSLRRINKIQFIQVKYTLYYTIQFKIEEIKPFFGLQNNTNLTETCTHYFNKVI